MSKDIISELIFAPNGGYILYYPSNLFRNARSFENWGIFSDFPQLENIRSRETLRPIACERKLLMVYKLGCLNFGHYLFLKAHSSDSLNLLR